MKKRFAAAAIAAFLGIIFLFGQGPVQKVRLWDTNLSHSLLFQWNEDDVAGRTLNFLVDGASRSLSIFGDTWVEQDYRIAATPTFAGLYLESSTAAPFLKMTNESDTERDPIHQFSVGATPVIKWTYGVDDSDSDNFSWCNDDELVTTTTGGTGFGDYLGIVDANNDRVKRHLPADALTYVSQFGSTGSGDNNFSTPVGICTDGVYYYVVDTGNDRIKKHVMATGAFVWAVGTTGSGNTNFNEPLGICTDGVYLYVIDKGNYRIKKHLCSTGAYVAKLGAYGTTLGQFVSPTGICTDGTWLYITEGAPGAAPLLKKHLCSDLSGVAQISADGHLDSTNCLAICTDGINLWLANANNAALAAIFKYTRSLAYISEYGTNGSGDTQFDGPAGICADATHLFVSDAANHRIKKHLLSDYSYVSKIGSFGAGDDNFSGPKGICVGFLGDVRRGRLLRLHEDGRYFDVWPKLSLYNYLVFREDSAAAENYVAFRAPGSVTSYTLTLPGAAAGAKKHLYTDASDVLAWGQNVETDGSPTFVRGTFTQADGISPFVITSTTINTNLNADLLDGNHASAFGPAGVKYIVQEADATLIAEQALGDLATGILKNTTTTGVLSIALAGTDYEAALGNPDVDGKVLSSTALGVRSWIAAGGVLAIDDLTDVNAPAPDDNDILRFDTASGDWMNEPLPAAANHDILSATHADSTPSAVARGDIIIGSGATPKWTALAKGTETYVLTMGANEPAWAAPAAGGTHSLWFPDAFPASPTSQSDHFDDASLDVKWTAWQAGGGLSVSEAGHHLKYTNTGDNAYTFKGHFQALPSGDFTITVKVDLIFPAVNYLGAGVALYEDATNNPNTCKIYAWMTELSTGVPMTRVTKLNNYASWGSNPSDRTHTYYPPTYLRIRRNGTTLYFDHSIDGVHWLEQYSEAQWFAPAEMGLIIWNYAPSTTGIALFDWFYYHGADVLVSPVGLKISI